METPQANAESRRNPNTNKSNTESPATSVCLFIIGLRRQLRPRARGEEPRAHFTSSGVAQRRKRSLARRAHHVVAWVVTQYTSGGWRRSYFVYYINFYKDLV